MIDYRVEKVRLSETGRTVDEQRVVGVRLDVSVAGGIIRDRDRRCVREFIRVSDDEVVERVLA